MRVVPGDSEESLHEAIKVAERTLYPETVAWALGELQAGRAIETRHEPVRPPAERGVRRTAPLSNPARRGRSAPGPCLAHCHGRPPALARHHDPRHAARWDHIAAPLAA